MPRVPHPLDVTFGFLATATDEAADLLLRAALDLPAVRGRAALALLKRGSTAGLLEIVRRVAQFEAAELQALRQHGGAIARVVRPLLDGRDAADRQLAREATGRLELYPLLAQVIDLLARGDAPDSSELMTLATRLCHHLYGLLNPHDGPTAAVQPAAGQTDAHLADAEQLRRQAVAALARGCLALEAHRAEPLAECLLMLGRPADAPIRQVFQEAGPPLARCLERTLLDSRHPGVMRFVTDALTENYAPRAAFEAFARRADARFAAQVLQSWPAVLTPIHAENLRAVHEAAWLNPGGPALAELPEALQPRLAGVVGALGLNDDQRLAVLEWMVRHGGDAARLAACDLLSVLESQKVQDVVLESLEAREAAVQAWATAQLRSLEVPKAMELLLERLGSPVPEVREAARAELGDFRMARVLEIFGQVPPRSYAAVARLVRTIDPCAAETLRHELTSSTPRRAVRAARVAQALGFHTDVAEALVALSRADESVVRRSVVEVLAEVADDAALAALIERLRDPSPRVRQAAAEAVRRWHRRHAADEPLTGPREGAWPLPAGAAGETGIPALGGS